MKTTFDINWTVACLGTPTLYLSLFLTHIILLLIFFLLILHLLPSHVPLLMHPILSFHQPHYPLIFQQIVSMFLHPTLHLHQNYHHLHLQEAPHPNFQEDQLVLTGNLSILQISTLQPTL